MPGSRVGDSQTSDRPRCVCHGEAMLRGGGGWWRCRVKHAANMRRWRAKNPGVGTPHSRNHRSRGDQARITELLAQLPDSVKEVLRG